MPDNIGSSSEGDCQRSFLDSEFLLESHVNSQSEEEQKRETVEQAAEKKGKI